MSTSIFATSATALEDVQHLVENLDHFVSAEGVIHDVNLKEWGKIGYSRAWLILRRAWLEQNQKSVLWSPTKKQVADAEKKFGHGKQTMLRHVYGPKAVELRDEAHSWGEIAVRMGISESTVRAAFKAAEGEGGRRDVGLRIGKGGRFAADRPDLYQDNRRVEGAEVPLLKGVTPSTVKVEQLKNFHPTDA